MPITTRQLIRGALRMLGAVASGENVEANEAFDALQALNALIESWSLERLLIYHIPRLEVPTVPGQRVYTWGPAPANIVGARPLRLERALLTLGPGSGGPSGELEWPIRVWSQQEYEAGIRLKSLGSTYPLGVYLESSFPLARLHTWPVPTLSTTRLLLFPWLRLMGVADLDTLITFPEGYQRMLQAGLAVELSPEYGKEVPLTVAAILAESKASVKRVNVNIPLMGQPVRSVYDTYASMGASRYDIRSDGGPG